MDIYVLILDLFIIPRLYLWFPVSSIYMDIPTLVIFITNILDTGRLKIFNGRKHDRCTVIRYLK